MTPKQIEKFDPFQDLDNQGKLLAANLMAMNTVKRGVSLFEIGENDDIEYFLVGGEVELVAFDGVTKTIDAEDSAARFPLALLRPRKFRATVTSDHAQLMTIDVNVLSKLRQTIPVVGDTFSAFSPSQAESTLDASRNDADGIKRFLVGASNAITENRLLISNFDDVSGTIFKVVQSPDVDLGTVISAVQLDAAITAKLIKSANSAFFGGMAKVDSVRAAVVRLGLDLTVQLVSMMVMKEVFNSTRKSLQHAMHAIWQSSLKLATYTVVVGRSSGLKLQQGQLLLAGLMNEIGALVVVAYLDQFPSGMQSISEHVLASAKVKKKLGRDLLRHWKFPDTIIEVIEESDNYERHVPEADMCDAVTVAKLLIWLTSYRKLPVAEISETPAFKRLGFDGNNHDIIQDISEEASNYLDLFIGAFTND